ncbi:MAG: DoxX family protein [Bryobacteraceae bacterium]
MRNRAGFWITTSFFGLWMLFTAYAQLTLPQVKQMFEHLGFPDYFRIELSIAKIAGVLILLIPAPARLKEWTFAGFAITLTSALIAHLSVGDGAAVYMWSVIAGMVLGLSYFFYHR